MRRRNIHFKWLIESFSITMQLTYPTFLLMTIIIKSWALAGCYNIAAGGLVNFCMKGEITSRSPILTLECKLRRLASKHLVVSSMTACIKYLHFLRTSLHNGTTRAQNKFFKCLSELLTSICIYQRINKRITNDEDQEKVKVTKIALAIRVGRTRQNQDQVQKKWTPANYENSQKNGQSNGTFHACSLTIVFM